MLEFVIVHHILPSPSRMHIRNLPMLATAGLGRGKGGGVKYNEVK
jgi:hypothetical protein